MRFVVRQATPLLVKIIGRRRLVFALVGSTLVAILELIGVSLVLPLIIAVADPSAASALPDLIQDLVPDSFDRSSASLLALGVVAVFAVRAAVTLAFRWWLFGVTSRGEADLASTLMLGYLRAPIEFHRSRASSDLIRVLQLSTEHFFVRITLPLLTLLTEGTVVLVLATGLLILEPLITVCALAYFSISGAVFSMATARRMQRLGRRFQTEHADAMRAAQEALGGWVEAIVRQVTHHFVARFAGVKRRTAHTKQRQQFISELPRNYLESAFLVGIGLLVLLVLATSPSQSAATASLALVAAVGFRMMPSLIKIVTALTAVRAGTGALELVTEDIELLGIDRDDFTRVRRSELSPPDAPPSEAEAVPHIVVDHVSYQYPDQTGRPVVDDVFFEVPARNWCGVIGESGAGKTTLLLMLLGLLAPSAGAVRADDQPITDEVSGWRRLVGYVPQDIYLLDDTLAENIRFGLRSDDDEQRLQEALRGASLESFVSSLEEGLETRVAEGGARFSGGQRQRIGVARALYRRPRVLILDEATSALDVETEAAVLDTLERLRQQMTIISVAHGISAVRRCDAVVVLAHGSVRTSGRFADVAIDDPLLRGMTAGE